MAMEPQFIGITHTRSAPSIRLVPIVRDCILPIVAVRYGRFTTGRVLSSGNACEPADQGVVEQRADRFCFQVSVIYRAVSIDVEQ